MTKRLMILGGSEIQKPVIEKCKRNGYCAIVVDNNPDAPGIEIADVPLIVSTNDKAVVLKNAIHEKIDGILTTSDLPVRVVAHVASKFNFPALSERSAFLTTNKFELRNKLKQENFNVPEYSVIQDSCGAEHLKNFPYVVKPVDSSGSRGVKKVCTEEELHNWLPEALNYSGSKKIMVEGFVEGREYSIESLTQNGKTYIIAVTEKSLIANNKGYFVENGHIVPAFISKRELEEIKTTVKQAIEVLKIDHSACHTELKVKNGKITIIEIGARLGGDFIGSHLVQLATGVDMLQNVINLAMGKPISVTATKNNFAAIQFLNPNNYYLAKKFVQKSHKGIHSYNFEPFQNVEIKNSFNRLGHIILCFEERKDLSNALNKINVS